MNLERQDRLLHHHQDEEEEEEEEEVALLVRQSRHNSAQANERAEEHAPEAEKEKQELGNAGGFEEDWDEMYKNSVYFDTQQGNESVDGFSGMKNVEDESVVLETHLKDEELLLSADIIHDNGKNLEDEILSSLSLPMVQMPHEKISVDSPTEITQENGKNLEDETLSSLSLPVVQMSHEEISIDLEHLKDKTGEHADVDFIEEVDQEFTEIDVEMVLKKQNTHDLYCPNCNSRITRVILHRKKPEVPNIPHRPNRGKSKIQSVPDANAANATNGEDPGTFNSSNDAPTHVANDDNHDKQPEAFGCLSCFSIFIPTGNGLKLFQSIPAPRKNWFPFLFASNNKKPDIDQVAPPDDGSLIETGAFEEDTLVMPEKGELDSLNHSKVESNLTEELLIDHKTNMETENNTLAHDNGLDLSTEGALSPIKAPSSAGLVNSALIDSQEVGKGIVNSTTKELIPCNDVSSDVEKKSTQGASSVNPLISGGLSSSALVDSLEAGRATECSVMKERIPYKGVSSDVSVSMGDLMINSTAGDDVIVNVPETEPVEQSPSLRVPNVDTSLQKRPLPDTGTRTRVDHPQSAAASEALQLDILKSIVYGGLVESITSLGVVSSAAAAGASTLNILALGLANLIGGLFIIAHNVRELRNDHSGETGHEDRYRQQLGRRDRFSLHVTVVVLSFLIFGLVPPVIYSFSFRKSDNADYKLAAVAGSSLACIFLLAVGKAYVQTPPKSYIKTTLHYVILGFMSSGVSYVVGDLFKILMEKLNWFESSIDFMIPHQKNPGWESY